MSDPEQPSPSDPPPEKRRLSKLAVASLTMACLSLLCFFVSLHLAHKAHSDFESCIDWRGYEFIFTSLSALLLFVSIPCTVAALILVVVRRKKLWGVSICIAVLLSYAFTLVIHNMFPCHHGLSKRSEGKTNLRGAFSTLKTKFSQTGRYPATLAEAGFDPAKGRRYAIFYNDEIIQPDRRGHGPYSKDNFPRVLKKYLAECKKAGFVVVALGNIDCDPELDAIVIDDRNNLVIVYDDLGNEETTRANPCTEYAPK